MTPELKGLTDARKHFGSQQARAIADLYIYVTEAGLRGVGAAELFDGFCRRLVEIGMRLSRAHVSTQTLHPQWTGYGFTWMRKLNAVNEQSFARVETPSAAWLQSPFFSLIERARAGEAAPTLRRRLALGPDQRDYPALLEFHSVGATDYYATVYAYGERGDPAQGAGVVLSFATDAPDGFPDMHVELLDAALPGLALALKAHAGREIASNLLAAYLGADAGRRVHAGAVVRGEADRINAVIWYADLKGFTDASDRWPGPAILDMLDASFEALTAPLRARGGQVLKFIGDAMLAIFPVDGDAETEVCRRAFDAADEALVALHALNRDREVAGAPFVQADIALHIGEVLYGNIGAADRLDFTVIGPAVNEAARIEKLCDALGRNLLASERFATAAGLSADRLLPLGEHNLRGVATPQTLYGPAPAVAPTS